MASGPSGSLPGLANVVTSPQTFSDRVRTREARIGIIGLGYAGLPLAMAFAEQGFYVTGIDLDEERVRAVRERRSYLVDVPEHRYASVDDRLSATSDSVSYTHLTLPTKRIV